MDSQIWYAVFSTIFGGISGSFRRLGEVWRHFSCNNGFHYLIDLQSRHFSCTFGLFICFVISNNQLFQLISYFLGVSFCVIITFVAVDGLSFRSGLWVCYALVSVHYPELSMKV